VTIPRPLFATKLRSRTSSCRGLKSNTGFELRLRHSTSVAELSSKCCSTVRNHPHTRRSQLLWAFPKAVSARRVRVVSENCSECCRNKGQVYFLVGKRLCYDKAPREN
jgi:hypothetical protein